MIDSNPPPTSTGPGVCGLLGVAFVVLKLTDVIDWSWWYVTMPFWGGAAVGSAIIVGATLIWFISDGSSNRKQLKLATARRLTEIEILEVAVEERKLARQLECPYMQEGLREVEEICS